VSINPGCCMGSYSSFRFQIGIELFKAIFWCALLGILAGCGGGVRGTNPNPGEKSLVEIVIVDPFGNPIQNTFIQRINSIEEESVVTSASDGSASFVTTFHIGDVLEIRFEEATGLFFEDMTVGPVDPALERVVLRIIQDNANQDFSIIGADLPEEQAVANDPIEDNGTNHSNSSSKQGEKDKNSGRGPTTQPPVEDIPPPSPDTPSTPDTPSDPESEEQTSGNLTGSPVRNPDNMPTRDHRAN